MKLLKNNRMFALITSLIILVPMAAGLLLWQRLPDTVATSFDFSGTPAGWNSKPFAVFFLPLFMLAMQWVCIFAMSADPKRGGISDKMFRLALMICPASSIFCGVLIYGHALAIDVNDGMLGKLFLGGLFAVIGNYLPKCRQNYTMGIKLPWTLNDAENWNRTHRLAGRLWILGGLVMLIDAFLGRMNAPALLAITALEVLIPTLYSFVYYVRHGAER